jgi:hypothetical protein
MNRRATPRSIFLVKMATLRECNALIRPLQNGEKSTIELQLHGQVGPHAFKCSARWLPCEESLYSVEETSHGWPKDIGAGGNKKSNVAYPRLVRQALEKLVGWSSCQETLLLAKVIGKSDATHTYLERRRQSARRFPTLLDKNFQVKPLIFCGER